MHTFGSCVAHLQCCLPAPPPLLSYSELQVLEMDKGGYERGELEALSTSLPRLTRLVLAGGLVGSHMPDW